MLAAVVDCASRVSPKQLVRTLVSVCATQDPLDKLPGSVVKGLLGIPYVFAFRIHLRPLLTPASSDVDVELTGAMAWMGAERFMSPLVNGLLAR